MLAPELQLVGNARESNRHVAGRPCCAAVPTTSNRFPAVRGRCSVRRLPRTRVASLCERRVKALARLLPPAATALGNPVRNEGQFDGTQPLVAECRSEHGRSSGRSVLGGRQPCVVRGNPNVVQSTLNSPRQRVIQSAPLCHSPNHIAPARSVHWNGPCLLDGSRLRQEAGRPYCPARSAGSDPSKTSGFAAQWVFPSHTYCAGSLPAKLSLREGERLRRHGRIRRRRRCPPRPGGVDATNGACAASGWPGRCTVPSRRATCSARGSSSSWASMPSVGRLRS